MSASLSNEEFEDRYFLLGQVEILSVLNDLAHRREPVSIYFNDGQSFILSIILSARNDGLVFDLGGDERANKLLEKSKQCVFMTFPDGIRIQFSGVNPTRFMWGDEDAFWVPIPKRLIRLQRRDNYRNLSPVSNPLRVKLLDEVGRPITEWKIHDLSVGGFGVVIEGAPKLDLGDRVAQVWIPLPPKTNLYCPVIVRHITFIERTKLGKYQVGFSFENLSHVFDIAIQKTILAIEYERHRTLGQ